MARSWPAREPSPAAPGRGRVRDPRRPGRQPLQSRYAMRHGTTGAGALSPRSRADLDEDDVRVRPGRGTRPRTRRRPAHETAVQGFVTSVDRGRYGCMTDDGLVVAMKARELGKGSVVVGGRGALAGGPSGA